MKIKIYIPVLFLLVACAYGQQQTLYTNYLMNQYIYNPAFAGVEDGTQFNLGYRNQWLGFEGAPKTFMVNGYGKLKKKPNMAVGGLVTTERIGLLQRTTFYGTYSYHLKINKKAAINFGLGIGGIQHKVRVYDARPYDRDDSFLASDVLNAFAFDANAGFYFYTKNFFLGFSDQHMPNSKILWDNSTGRNTNHFYAYTGYNIHLNKDWAIQPSILARTNSPAPYQIEYNVKGIYNEMFWAGFSYRHESSGCFLFGCKIDKQYSFGYSYDLTLTDINNYSSGSHEIVLSYLIPFKKKKSKSELIKDADEEELNKIDNTLKTNLRNKKKKENEKKAEKENEKQVEEQPQKAEEPQQEKTTEPEVKTEPVLENKTETPVDETKQPETGNKTETPVEKPQEVSPDAGTNTEQSIPKTNEPETPKATEIQSENTQQQPGANEIKPQEETKKETEPKK